MNMNMNMNMHMNILNIIVFRKLDEQLPDGSNDIEMNLNMKEAH